MSKMSQLHAALCEQHGRDVNDDDIDWDAPTGEPLLFCDVCDLPCDEHHPGGWSIAYGIETFAHQECPEVATR